MCLILDRNTYTLSICFHDILCPRYKINITTVGVFHLLLLFYVWICALCLFVSPHTHVCTYRGHGLMLVIFLYLFSYTWFFETVSISQTKTLWLPEMTGQWAPGILLFLSHCPAYMWRTPLKKEKKSTIALL